MQERESHLQYGGAGAADDYEEPAACATGMGGTRLLPRLIVDATWVHWPECMTAPFFAATPLRPVGPTGDDQLPNQTQCPMVAGETLLARSDLPS